MFGVDIRGGNVAGFFGSLDRGVHSEVHECDLTYINKTIFFSKNNHMYIKVYALKTYNIIRTCTIKRKQSVQFNYSINK